jgi:hypothetical protein
VQLNALGSCCLSSTCLPAGELLLLSWQTADHPHYPSIHFKSQQNPALSIRTLNHPCIELCIEP